MVSDEYFTNTDEKLEGKILEDFSSFTADDARRLARKPLNNPAEVIITKIDELNKLDDFIRNSAKANNYKLKVTIPATLHNNDVANEISREYQSRGFTTRITYDYKHNNKNYFDLLLIW